MKKEEFEEFIKKLKKDKKRFKEFTDLSYIKGWKDCFSYVRKRAEKLSGG